jgi:hypothetical protein
MATIECKLAMCINRLVEFELLFELKIEQKSGTSLVKPVLSRRKSGLRTERLSVPLIYFGYRHSSSGTPPDGELGPFYNRMDIEKDNNYSMKMMIMV